MQFPKEIAFADIVTALYSHMMAEADFSHRGSHGRFHNMHEAMKASNHDEVWEIAKAFADADPFALWTERKTIRDLFEIGEKCFGLCELGFAQITRKGYIFKSFEYTEHMDKEMIVVKSGKHVNEKATA
jgi:hypothetical protein